MKKSGIYICFEMRIQEVGIFVEGGFPRLVKPRLNSIYWSVITLCFLLLYNRTRL